jgi:hypothetical protein
MKSTSIALAAGTAVASAALSLRALMRHRATAALPVPTPNLQLRVPGFPVLERITGGVDPAQPMPLVRPRARPQRHRPERGLQLLQSPLHRRLPPWQSTATAVTALGARETRKTRDSTSACRPILGLEPSNIFTGYIWGFHCSDAGAVETSMQYDALVTPDTKSNPKGADSNDSGTDDPSTSAMATTGLETAAKKSLVSSASNVVSAIAERIPDDDKRLMGENLGEAGVALTRFLNFAIMPIVLLVYMHDKVLQWLLPRVEKNLKDTPQEKLKQPEHQGTVLAALEAARFAEGEELRDMFGRLIASSMHTDRYQKVHPSFVEVLKQLAPDEARILTLVFPRPLIELRAIDTNSNSFALVLRHVCDLADAAQVKYPDNLSTYITNLCRLGLCEIPEFYLEKVADEEYKALANSPLVLEHFRQIIQNNDRPEITRKMIDLTSFGKALREVCGVVALPPSTPPP